MVSITPECRIIATIKPTVHRQFFAKMATDILISPCIRRTDLIRQK